MSAVALEGTLTGSGSSGRPNVSAGDVILAITLGLMVLLPLIEIATRLLGRGGIAGSTAIVQHCTLVVSMVGAAVAARHGRLLSIGTASLLPARIRPAGAFVASTGAAAVAAILCVASLQFVTAERASGIVLAHGVPVWVIETVLPLGFAAIALRLLASSARRWSGRLAAALGVAAVAVTALSAAPARGVDVLGMAGVSMLAAAGAPIFAVIGGAALAAYRSVGIPFASMTVSHYSLVVNPSLPAIPLFTLAGYVLAEGGASTRLVRFFDALVGGIRGGPAVVTVLACAFFTTFTGGSGVTILALGGLLFPLLVRAKYRERDALGLVTGAGALGILFPPCLPLILYGIAAEVDVHRLFLAGIVPGALLLLLTMLLGWFQQPPVDGTRRFDGREVAVALRAATWDLLLPVLVLTVLFTGIATPVEASAVTAAYAIFVETVLHRGFRDAGRLVRTFRDCGLLVGGIFLILGVALGLTGFLIDAEVPQHAVAWVTANVHSPIAFLLLLNAFLIVVGALMDIYSAIIVVVPLIVPLGVAYGIDPLHLGVIFLTNLELGYLLPPVGENLFIAACRFDRPVGELVRAVMPMVAVLGVAVVLVTYIPSLSLRLVQLAGSR